MRTFLSVFNIVMGLGIYGIWVRYIVLGKFRGAFFKAREGENIMWPHVIVEFLTAAALVVSGGGMLYGLIWADILSVFALGSLFYASFNSLAWVFADKERWKYSPAVLIGLIGSLLLILVILIELKH